MTHRLSKSRFQTGLQCPKALWLSVNARDLADPLTESQAHIFDTGTTVGELARTRFEGGVLIEEDHTQSDAALARTADLLADPPPALFESAFRYENVFVRPDALVHVADNEWDLYEVKSSTRVKPEHITDVAVQTWVLEGAGLRIRRAYLMHLNNTYVYPGGEHDPARLFTAADVTDDMRAWIHEVPRRVADQLAMLAEPVPAVRIGRHCATPYRCAYHGHCHAHLPDKPVTSLPRISASVLDSLLRDGILSIGDVPPDYPGLTHAQRTVIEVVSSGVARMEGDPRESLSTLEYPIHFVDFETLMSALPLWPGTRPWQQVPFQWSDHVLHSDGRLEHHEFLHEGDGDPREEFTRSLLEALGRRGSVVVYSGFENTRLGELAAAYPSHAEEIASVRERIFDLMKVVERHVRHPDTLGSCSIKAVLPALVPDLTYDGLEISEGATASLRYLKVITGKLDGDEAQATYAALREYCGLDTLAMVRLCEALNAGG